MHRDELPSRELYRPFPPPVRFVPWRTTNWTETDLTVPSPRGGGEDTMGGPTMSRHAVLAGFVLLGLALTTPAHTAETPLGAATVTFVVS